MIDPNIAGVSNMVDCKIDLTVKKDAERSVMIRWLPEMLFIDQRQAWGNTEGAIFNNTLVRRKRDPVSFIIQVAIPYAHPKSENIKVVEHKPLPELATLYANLADPSLKMYINISYKAALVEFTYEENGKEHSERMVTVIEDYGMSGAGLWKNTHSEINKDMYLTLTGQDEYKNPFTGKQRQIRTTGKKDGSTSMVTFFILMTLFIILIWILQ